MLEDEERKPFVVNVMGKQQKITRQGLPFYHSQTLTIEDNSLIFGELYKKTKSETAKFFAAFKN